VAIVYSGVKSMTLRRLVTGILILGLSTGLAVLAFIYLNYLRWGLVGFFLQDLPTLCTQGPFWEVFALYLGLTVAALLLGRAALLLAYGRNVPLVQSNLLSAVTTAGIGLSYLSWHFHTRARGFPGWEALLYYRRTDVLVFLLPLLASNLLFCLLWSSGGSRPTALGAETEGW